ncbi:hypothetical protein [Saccharopolyspora hordei]|uniref:Uncharacterized protein n=1 Tax=Saccharopolyspora hordei TaxID=1838 RepID=A0A853AP41_9PSEU|nr:hypothetical protein [Saccharopolyspora hordei]NYI82100.1 hypothetical protein [Saccharopolyspora hordei]
MNADYLAESHIDRVTRNRTGVSGYRVEIKKTPVKITGRGDDGQVVFGEWVGAVPGPIDDSIVYYRAAFDSTLALITLPKWRMLAGRQQ